MFNQKKRNEEFLKRNNLRDADCCGNCHYVRIAITNECYCIYSGHYNKDTSPIVHPCQICDVYIEKNDETDYTKP